MKRRDIIYGMLVALMVIIVFFPKQWLPYLGISIQENKSVAEMTQTFIIIIILFTIMMIVIGFILKMITRGYDNYLTMQEYPLREFRNLNLLSEQTSKKIKRNIRRDYPLKLGVREEELSRIKEVDIEEEFIEDEKGLRLQFIIFDKKSKKTLSNIDTYEELNHIYFKVFKELTNGSRRNVINHKLLIGIVIILYILIYIEIQAIKIF